MIIEIAFEVKDALDRMELECRLHEIRRPEGSTGYAFVTKYLAENISLQDMETRYTEADAAERNRQPEVRKIRQSYMDKYEGGPPWKGDKGFTSYISWLEDELARKAGA